MAPALLQYPLDTTGISPTNLIVGEEHNIGSRKVRVVAPRLGSFFAGKMTVVDAATDLPLRSDQGYVSERLDMPTVQMGQDVCLVYVITDETVSDTVLLTYQAVGGMYTGTGDSLVQQFYALPDVERATNWPNILRRKNEWASIDLEYDIATSQGFETTVLALQRIDQMTTQGDEVSHDMLRKYALNEVERLGSATNLSIQNLMADHVAAADPHAQYILLADLGEAIDGVRTPHNVTPIDGATDLGYTSLTFTGDQYRALYEIPQGGMQFQLGTSMAFDGQLVTDITLAQATNTFTVSTGIIPAQRYYWRVRYQNIEGVWSKWSNPSTFITKSTYIVDPAITSPVQGSYATTDMPVITGSSFQSVGIIDTHASTDWEIWEGPNGTGAKAFSSVNDAANKTSITVTTGLLKVNKTYYARVRYTGATLGLSNWSKDIAFSTPPAFLPTVAGTPFMGGYYAGQITYGGKTYAIVLAPKASGEGQSALASSSAQVQSYSTFDSPLNTNALSILAAGAARTSRSMTIGGFTDWCIPSKDVMAIIAATLKPSLSNIATAFKTGGSEVFNANPYWTSTAIDTLRDDSTYTQGAPIYGTVYEVYDSYSDSQWQSNGGVTASCAGEINGNRATHVVSSSEAGINPATGKADTMITKSWDCEGPVTKVVGYQQIKNEVYTPVFYAVTQNVVTGAVSNADKVNSLYYRAVRLVDVATLTPEETVPSAFGAPYQGGFYGGQIVIGNDVYALVVSPKALGQTNLPFKPSSTSEGAWSTLDGKTFSDVYATNPSVYPACAFAKALNIGGYTDWYIPARDELEVLYRNLKPTTDANIPQVRDPAQDNVGSGSNNYSSLVGYPYDSSVVQTSSPLFKSGGAEAFDPHSYITCSQFPDQAGASIYRQTFNSGVQTSIPKSSTYYTYGRAIRRVKLGTLPSVTGLNPGDSFEGGYYVGRYLSGNSFWALIAAPASGGQTASQFRVLANPGAIDLASTSVIDGWYNTNLQARADPANWKAAAWARGLTLNGRNDWYIPAASELEMLYRNLKPTTAASVNASALANVFGIGQMGTNPYSTPTGAPYTATSPVQTSLAVFKVGGAEALNSAATWNGSSSHCANLDAGRAPYAQDMVTGKQALVLADGQNAFRAVRRIRVK